MKIPQVGTGRSMQEQYERALYCYGRADEVDTGGDKRIRNASLMAQIGFLADMFEFQHEVTPHDLGTDIDADVISESGLWLNAKYVVRVDGNAPTDDDCPCDDVDFSTSDIRIIYAGFEARLFDYLTDSDPRTHDFVEDVYLIGVDTADLAAGDTACLSYVPFDGLTVLSRSIPTIAQRQ